MNYAPDNVDASQASKINPNIREHLINGISGLIAGACGVFVGHPFDTMKIRLQVGDVRKEASVGAKSVRELYRGLIPPLCTAGLTQFAVFTIYEHTKLQLMHDTNANPMNNLPATFVAATIAGGISSFVASPIQLMKVQQQSSSTALTLRQCCSNIFQKNGWKGLFHGSTSVLMVEGIGRGVYMLVYEYMKAAITADDRAEITVQTKAISAACAGSFSWFIMYPLDSIKSRRLSDLNSKSSYECYKLTMNGGGIRAFYRGCGFAMLRSVPVAATILPLYEYCREKLTIII